MEFHVTLTGRSDLAAEIFRQVRAAVLDGRLRAGDRLPPSRELAGRLAVSRTTVAAAYDRLIAEGFLVGRVGAGTFVAGVPAGTPAGAWAGVPAATPRARRAPAGDRVAARPFWQDGPAPTGPASRMPYDFRVGVPDTELFPWATWRRLVASELRPAAAHADGYGDPGGHPALRAAIARHVGVSRSVLASPEDVIVTAGAQQAFDLIGRVLLEPGDVVAVEEPGYAPARELFASLGARVVGVRVDEEGLDVAALPRSARLVHVTPSHQFPLGTPMSLSRRLALLAWVDRTGAVVVEDDYDSEFRYEDRPLEPLQSLDRSGRVLYVGTFAKTMQPGLRMGFVVAPASLQPALRRARQLTDWHGDLTTQGALARFLDDGLLARHVRTSLRAYAQRRRCLVDALRQHLPELTLVPCAAGLHVCARWPADARVDVRAGMRSAARQGVAAQPLDAYFAAPSQVRGLVLGYGAIPLDRVEEGVRRLADALTAVGSAAAGSRVPDR